MAKASTSTLCCQSPSSKCIQSYFSFSFVSAIQVSSTLLHGLPSHRSFSAKRLCFRFSVCYTVFSVKVLCESNPLYCGLHLPFLCFLPFPSCPLYRLVFDFTKPLIQKEQTSLVNLHRRTVKKCKQQNNLLTYLLGEKVSGVCDIVVLRTTGRKTETDRLSSTQRQHAATCSIHRHQRHLSSTTRTTASCHQHFALLWSLTLSAPI